MFGSPLVLFVVAVISLPNRSELSRKPKSPQPAEVKTETPTTTSTTTNDPNTATATTPTADSTITPAAAPTTTEAATTTPVSGSAAEADKAPPATSMSMEATSPKCYYDLFGTANHVGSMESGHYVSNVNVDGTWYHCNDAHVIKTEESNVLHNEGTAYVLFYARRGAK